MLEGVAKPVGDSARIRELDVLRGVALFGVLLMNFVSFAGPGILATAVSGQTTLRRRL